MGYGSSRPLRVIGGEGGSLQPIRRIISDCVYSHHSPASGIFRVLTLIFLIVALNMYIQIIMDDYYNN